MASIFIALYQYFEQRKVFLFLLLSAILISSLGFTFFNIQLNEDVSKVIPLDEGIKKVNTAYQNSKFSDNLIFHLSPTDTTNFEQTDGLIDFADSLVQQIEALDSSQIKEIRYKLSDAAINDLLDVFYQHLPLFLTDKDYADIAQRLDSASVDQTLQSVYKTLISPVGFMMKKSVIRDPMSLSTLPLKRLKDFQVEGNYTLHKSRIMTKDKKHLLFFVTPQTTAASTGENAALLATIDQKIAQAQAQFKGQFEAEYFGSIAVSVANAQQIKKDINYTVGAALIALFIFIILFFRNWLTPLYIFVPVVLGASIGIASLILLKSSISAISLGVGAVLLGITVDFSLHVFVHHRAEGDIQKTLQAISTPTIMSSLTTSSAFLCLLYMSSEAMQDLGIFAAVSVLSAAIFALLVLPHLLPKKTAKAPQKTNKKSILDRIAAYSIDRNKFVLGGVLGLTILFLFFYRNVGFEDDMNNINFMTEELRQADQNLRQMGGEALRSTYVVAAAPSLEEALQANEKARQRLQKLKEKGLVQSYTTVSNFMPSQKAQKEKIEQWQQFWTPSRKAKIKEALQQQGLKFKFKEKSFNPFYQLLDQSFEVVPPTAFEKLRQLFLNEYITTKNNQYSLVSIVKLDLDKKSTVYAAFDGLVDCTIFDKQFIANQFAQSLKKDFGKLVNWSFLIVFIILLVAFGRIELTLLTMLPILLSWVWTLGIMGIIGLQFNVINVIICTFIFGLGIDYSIFVTKGLLHEYKYGERILPAYKTSILLSALTTMCGMGVMIFAQHPALFSIASLSIIGIVSILLITFTIQPILFRYLIVDRKKKGLPPYTFINIIATIVAYTFFVSGCLLLTALSYLFTITPIRKYKKKYVIHRLMQLLCGLLVKMMFNVRKQYINRSFTHFEKPSMIIANHQSFLDIVMILMLYPKIIILTNNWVWNSPIFGKLIQFADFYPADRGAESSAEHLEKMVDRGYSVMVFPEGTRSVTGKIGRFKKGAFYIAEKLGIDILPVVFHGTGSCIRKKDFLVHSTTVTMKFLDRIKPNDRSWGEGYSKRGKKIGKYFKKEYQKVREKVETPDFFEARLLKNYIYKGPTLEWYARIKVRLEDKYAPFDKIIPKKAKIVDIGCGYGMMAYMLHLLSDDRTILGVDYDQEKIKVAQACFLNTNNPKIAFEAADATTYEWPQADVFLISDMLHYIPTEKQTQLIKNCLERLNENGLLIIRDGDRDLKDRHQGTVWTERFSTKIFNFNKTTQAGLTFLSGKKIEAIAQDYGLSVERIDLSQNTSNIIFVIQRKVET